jgi:excisionase family DNA binding protein
MTQNRAELGRLVPRLASRAPDQFRTVRQTAEYLGVSDRTVRRFIDAGHLLSHRIGRSVRISEADLRAYLARSR